MSRIRKLRNRPVNQNELLVSVTTTPTQITDKIREACRQISPSAEPGFVSVVPDSGAQPLRCWQNVEAKCKASGGRAVFGWLVWQCSSFRPLFVDAEPHAVWEKDGEYIDVTPQQDGETRILFLADPSMRRGKS